MDVSSRQNISKNKVEPNSIINHLDKMDIHSLLDATKVDYTLFSNVLRTFAIKHIEDNIGENLDNLGLDDDFLDTTPKAQPMLNFIRIKNFHSVKAV